MTSQHGREVHLLGFGEPAGADRGETIAYLERIFRANARLDGDLSEEAIEARCRELAERRAPGLLEDYERIGGSPLLEQCRLQARALTAELGRRGAGEVTVRVGMQFTQPFIADIAREALDAGASDVIALPLYPLCGASTTVAAVDDLRAALRAAAGAAGRAPPRLAEITGWHAHARFAEVVAESVASTARAHGASLEDPATRLYFSAHGTPVSYLREGSRYDRYVEELCALVAARLGVGDYALGYQNHANRGVAWTGPSNEELLPTLAAERLIVVPVSFIHEQSETLVELDVDLRELASAHGKEFLRVPVPFDAPGLVATLADLVQPFLGESGAGEPAPLAGGQTLRPCRCRPVPGAWCLNSAS